MRGFLFFISSIGAGICAYLTLAYYIEATSHTVALKPPFYAYGLGFILLLGTALKLKWRSWQWWTPLAAIAVMMCVVFVLYLRYFLPFP